jgi:hypothetical protein
MFKPEAGVRYDMPVVFGPSELRPQANFGETRTITHSFLTDPAVLAPMIPYHFKLAEPAKVIIGGHMQLDVDWLAGRPYHIVRAATEVERMVDGEKVRAMYSLVIWESDSRPVIAGREFLGLAKITGEIPAHERSEDQAAFELYEYGTRCLRVDVSDIIPVDQATVDEINRTSGDTITFGWKYIPGPGNTVDVDYPVKMISRGTLLSMAKGKSSVTFDSPTWEQCPHAKRYIDTLRTLPVLEVLPATLMVKKSQLDRGASSRID